MRTAAYNDDVASDRRRRQNVPRHILCSDNEKNAKDEKKRDIKRKTKNI